MQSAIRTPDDSANPIVPPPLLETTALPQSLTFSSAKGCQPGGTRPGSITTHEKYAQRTIAACRAAVKPQRSRRK